MTFAQQLKTIRNLRGITQKQLEKRTGIPNVYLCGMETGKVTPTGDWEARIKQALDWPDDAAFEALMPTAELVA